MKVELVTKTVGVGSYDSINCEEIISAVARYGVIKEDNGKLVRYLMDHSHWSPLQHISYGFLIETSRAISAQIFRHRSLNFQETSQRYQKITDFEEIELRKEHPKNRQSSTDAISYHTNLNEYIEHEGYQIESVGTAVDDVLELSEKVYKALLDTGVAKECARMVLPMASKTTIHVTGTLRDLLAFLNVRCHIDTQKELRDIATKMGHILEKELPNVFSVINWGNGYFM